MRIAVILVEIAVLIGSGTSQGASYRPERLCQWLHSIPISNPSLPPPTCAEPCGKMCADHPGEYFCSARQVFVDTDERKLEPAQGMEGRHMHCICSRSRLTRKPGKWCGAALDCDPDRSAEVEAGSVPTDGSDGYVDAYNTMIPGHQGDRWIALKQKLLDGKDIDDVEAYECNDLVQQEVDQLLVKFKDL